MIKKIINFFKKIFKPKRQEVDYSNLTKGDLKKLKSQGKIKDIYNPNN